MNHLERLNEISAYNKGERQTDGLSHDVLKPFIDSDPKLAHAIERAYEIHFELRKEFSGVLALPEADQIVKLQSGFVNFYSDYASNPYVAIAACGPWIVTSCGAVIHDSGGYGMLGLGHSPDNVLTAMASDHVMANIMTASFSQARLVQKLRDEIGHTHSPKKCPFDRFICMNSGSESVTVAARIADINAKIQTDSGGRHAGKKIKLLAFEGGFHGRTDRPAQASDSTRKNYQIMATFRDRDNLVTIPPNDVEKLREAFIQADKDGVFFELVLFEPVMGEGNPGVGMTPEFYKAARQLVTDHGSLLLIDSIQAGLRAHGVLSICDYPGFENLEAPDLETYSKALNAGQYPLSVLALQEKAAELYQKGVYGNTMTTNPRALEVACSVLDSVTPELRKNVTDRGNEFVEKLTKLSKEHPDVVTEVQGTGLLFCAHLNPQVFKAVGADSLETYLRTKGIGVIHGGENALRFTPHFRITSEEVDLVVSALKTAIEQAPRLGAGQPHAANG